MVKKYRLKYFMNGGNVPVPSVSDDTNQNNNSTDVDNINGTTAEERQWIWDFMNNIINITNVMKTIIDEKLDSTNGWSFGYTTSAMIYFCFVLLNENRFNEEDLRIAKLALTQKDIPNTFNVVISSDHISKFTDEVIRNINNTMGCVNGVKTTKAVISITFVHMVPDSTVKYNNIEIPIQKVSSISNHVNNMKIINNIHNNLNKCET